MAAATPGPVTGTGPSSAVPEAFLCPISHELMADPVCAADGHTYDRPEIGKWFATGKRTSPMTNAAMPNTMLTPNLRLKTLIMEWQGRSNEQWVADHIAAVVMAGSDPKAVEAKLLELAQFVAHRKAVIHPEKLQMLSSMLQGSQQLWVSPVQQSLRSVEAECKLVVSGLATQLRNERRDKSLAAVAATTAAGKLAQLDIEVAAAEEALEKVKGERAKQAKNVTALQQLERDCESSSAQVEKLLRGYPEPLAPNAEGEEGERGGAPGWIRSKRKRADREGEPSGTVVAKRQRGAAGGGGAGAELDCEALVQQGLEWYDGDNFRVINEVRGKLLIEAAAARGLSLAVAICQIMEWGGYSDADKHLDAFETFQELASDERETGWKAAVARHFLGNCYYYGTGVEEDEAECAKWYRQAAELGLSDAQNSLAVCLESGVDPTEEDKAEAVKWYRKAAEQGHSTAQFSLAVCYDDDRGVETDMVEAAKWYRKAAEQGHIHAQSSLALCYDTGAGVEKDYVEAVKWHRKAAEQDHEYAQYSLAVCYDTGSGVEEDMVEAVKWYRQAAEQGVKDAQRQLVKCYRCGIGVDKDEAEASRWEQRVTNSD
jgi:TPR repeat protein